MYVRMFWGKLKPNTWNEFEQIYRETITKLTEGVKGFRGRQLLRSTENSDEGLSITLWDTYDAMEIYARSPLHKEAAKRAQHLYVGEYWIRHFEIRNSSHMSGASDGEATADEERLVGVESWH